MYTNIWYQPGQMWHLVRYCHAAATCHMPLPHVAATTRTSPSVTRNSAPDFRPSLALAARAPPRPLASGGAGLSLPPPRARMPPPWEEWLVGHPDLTTMLGTSAPMHRSEKSPARGRLGEWELWLVGGGRARAMDMVLLCSDLDDGNGSTPGTSLVQRGEDDEEARSPGDSCSSDASDASDDGDHAAIVTAVRPSSPSPSW